jgi:hypothetical protein
VTWGVLEFRDPSAAGWPGRAALGNDRHSIREGASMSIHRIAFALAVALALCVVPARADLTITIEQDGSNVVATGSGTIDLAGLTFVGTETGGHAGVAPNIADIAEGPPNGITSDDYSGVTGPGSFGPGGHQRLVRFRRLFRRGWRLRYHRGAP